VARELVTTLLIGLSASVSPANGRAFGPEIEAVAMRQIRPCDTTGVRFMWE
jgi:hypothetical protein